MNPTTVINVRGRDRHVLLADPDFVYVGRTNRRTGWVGEGWGNPWRSGDFSGGVAACVEFFGARLSEMLRYLPLWANGRPWLDPQFSDLIHLDHQDFDRLSWMAGGLLEGDLVGKRLGCWCCDWGGSGEPERPCHAVTLARIADSLLVANDLRR